MASESTIRTQIEQIVGGDYFSWTIGVTDDPVSRKAHHGNPLNWFHWQADSREIATDIKNYFVGKGLKNGNKETNSGVFIYLF